MPGTAESLRKLEFAELVGDPYSLYEQMRVEQPVQRVVMPGRPATAWLVTRYEDVRAGLADPRLHKSGTGLREAFARQLPPETEQVEFAEDLAHHMLNMDPPDHTRLRKLVTKAFTARRMAALRPRIEEITEGLLADLPAGSEVDLLAAFAFPLPIVVICELLGVPDSDRDDFRVWSNVIVSSSGVEEMREAGLGLAGYLAALIERKRAEPGSDLLSALIEVSEEGDSLTLPELISMAFLLLVAGHETTVNLIGNGVLSLLRNPEQLAALRADPSLVPAAIEEFLRIEGPINLATLRYTAEPVEIGGVTIPAGELVFLSLMSANHDPDRFDAPDELDLNRATAGHMAFGHGIHYCLGAPLARLEAEVAFRALLAHYDKIELTTSREELVWRTSSLIHGVIELPVRLG
jgi:cytochrome P450